ncbi:hypothetical protein HPB47_001440 [Ixodes persulcatus]|uniref:Uncharacterized protein n=1 Tax=Ixodes persulcatus TaxID=34615 RepID=A0AC60PPS9_IXOPE|nr:hypothetical protein HPB47_001440 [Ixodes persulcatus]
MGSGSLEFRRISWVLVISDWLVPKVLVFALMGSFGHFALEAPWPGADATGSRPGVLAYVRLSSRRRVFKAKIPIFGRKSGSPVKILVPLMILMRMVTGEAVGPRWGQLKSVNLGCVCPLDTAKFDKDAVEKLRLRPGQLLKLSVSCWNAEHGCNFVGPVSELLDHFEKECIHHRASCPKCHQDVPRMGLVQHCVRDCNPTQGAEAPQPRDSYYGLQASVNTVVDDVKLGHSLSNRAVTEAVSGVLQQLDKTLPGLTKLGKQLLENFENARADIKQSIAELKDGYSGLQASVNAVTDDLKHGPSSSNDAVSSRLAQLQRIQSDAIHREGELLEDLRRSCAYIKQTVSDLKNDFSRLQTSSGAFKDDVELGHSGKRRVLAEED